MMKLGLASFPTRALGDSLARSLADVRWDGGWIASRGWKFGRLGIPGNEN